MLLLFRPLRYAGVGLVQRKVLREAHLPKELPRPGDGVLALQNPQQLLGQISNPGRSQLGRQICDMIYQQSIMIHAQFMCARMHALCNAAFYILSLFVFTFQNSLTCIQSHSPAISFLGPADEIGVFSSQGKVK